MSAVRIRVRVASQPASGLMAMVGYSLGGHIVALAAMLIIPRVIPHPPPPPLILSGQIVSMPAAWSGAEARAEPAGAPAPTPAPEAAKPIEKPPEKPPKPPVERKREVVPPEPGKQKAPKKEPPRQKATAPVTSEEPPEEPAPAPPGSAGGPAQPIPEGVGLSAGAGDPGSGIPSITSSVFPFDWYRTTIVNLIRSRWRRPVTPGLLSPLRCAVSFVVARNGALSDVVVSATSGFAPLDQSAHRAVLEAGPLPALPYQYSADSVRAELIFELTPD